MKKTHQTIALLMIIATLCTVLVSCSKSGDMNAIKAETTNDAVTISDVSLTRSPEGVVLEGIWNNRSASIITYGRQFTLETKEAGSWKKVSAIDGTGFTLEECMVYPTSISKSNESDIESANPDKRIKLFITNHYEIENDNEYRVTVEFHEMTDKEKSYQAVLYFNT